MCSFIFIFSFSRYLEILFSQIKPEPSNVYFSTFDGVILLCIPKVSRMQKTYKLTSMWTNLFFFDFFILKNVSPFPDRKNNWKCFFMHLIPLWDNSCSVMIKIMEYKKHEQMWETMRKLIPYLDTETFLFHKRKLDLNANVYLWEKHFKRKEHQRPYLEINSTNIFMMHFLLLN